MSEKVIAPGETLLRVEHLCQYFGPTKAVDDVSFDVKKGEVFGIVGESGCGKTTTGRSIIRIYDITSGSVYFKDQRICAGTLSYKKAIKQAKLEAKEKLKSTTNADEIEKIKNDLAETVKYNSNQIALAKHDHKHAKRDLVTQIQMIFQDPIASLNPRMTVREIIAEGLIIKGIKDKAYIDEQVYKILEAVGLQQEHAGRYPHEFSGGQRQRIGIARAAIMNPEMIIADEPVSALDVSVQAQVINLLNDLRESMGLTIIFIAHDLSVVKYFSDRIAVMYYGKMVELATADELFAHPLHPYTKSLLSAIPLPDPHYEKKRVRITYSPTVKPGTQPGDIIREIAPGHFVCCTEDEIAGYRKEIQG